MALTRLKTWIAGEVLTASDLNSEFNNIINNASSLFSPLTAALDMDGNELIMDADADSSLTVDTDDRLDVKLQGVDLFRFDGTVATPVNGLDYVASATGNAVQTQAVGSDTNIDLNLVPKGTGRVQESGDNIPTGTEVREARRRTGMVNFQAHTSRAMAMDNAGNMSLFHQVFS